MSLSSRSWSIVGLLIVLSLAFSTGTAVAQEETASVGNVGTSDCAANGGAAALGDVNAGINAGSAIGVGDSWGDVTAGGGAMSNSTDGTVAADGGAGICDGSGGDANLGLNIEPPPAPGPDRNRDKDDDEPEDELEVCVVVDGDENNPICGPGECERSDGRMICTLFDCSELGSDRPCDFRDCEVRRDTATCYFEHGG